MPDDLNTLVYIPWRRTIGEETGVLVVAHFAYSRQTPLLQSQHSACDQILLGWKQNRSQGKLAHSQDKHKVWLNSQILGLPQYWINEGKTLFTSCVVISLAMKIDLSMTLCKRELCKVIPQQSKRAATGAAAYWILGLSSQFFCDASWGFSARLCRPRCSNEPAWVSDHENWQNPAEYRCCRPGGPYSSKIIKQDIRLQLLTTIKYPILDDFGQGLEFSMHYRVTPTLVQTWNWCLVSRSSFGLACGPQQAS